MTEVAELEARIGAALAAIKTHASAAAPATDDDAALKALKAENAELRAALEALQQQRDKDVSDLDALLERLKPLVEEVG